MTASAVPLLDSRCELGESIVWCERRRVLYWADITRAQLWRCDPATGAHRHWRLPQALGCVALAQDGRVLLGLAKGLYGCDVEAQLDRDELALTPLAAVEPDREETRINDGRADRDGGFVFGTKGVHRDGTPAGRYYQYRADAGLRMLALPAVAIPNSICFSADGRTLYFCDSVHPRILRCRYDAAAAAVSDIETFAEIELPDAEPDGSVIDREGALWNAQWGAGRVVRYRTDGRIDRIVAVAAPQVSCCTLRDDVLYVTSARGGLDPDALAAWPLSGAVFAHTLGRPLARGEDRVTLP